MRETFPKKKKGDSLAARHVNDLSRVARQFAGPIVGSYSNAHQSGVAAFSTQLPMWTESAVEITNDVIDDDDTSDSGLYLCKIRYYDSTDEEWKSQDKEWQLDATAIGASLSVDDVVIAYFHQQRGMFVPVSGSEVASLVEARGDSTTAAVIHETGETSYEVEFWLERNDGTGWTKVHGRTFYINAYHPETLDLTVSGVGFVTFLANNEDRFRLAFLPSEALDDVILEYGVIKLEAKDRGGVLIADSVGPDANIVDDLVFEAEVNNVDGVFRWPKFVIDTTSTIQITNPDPDEENGVWTVEATFAITISVTWLSSSSSSSISTSSQSSSSTPSSSTDSSSISTSSVSSSSSSSISTSSESSSTSSSSSSSPSSNSSSSSSSSSSSAEPTACCGNEISRTLTATVTSSCAGIANQDVALVYNSGTGKWEGTIVCGAGPNIAFTTWCCDAGDDEWCSNIPCAATPTITLGAEEYDCNPFLWEDTWDAQDVSGCCDCVDDTDTISVAITDD